MQYKKWDESNRLDIFWLTNGTVFSLKAEFKATNRSLVYSCVPYIFRQARWSFANINAATNVFNLVIVPSIIAVPISVAASFHLYN